MRSAPWAAAKPLLNAPSSAPRARHGKSAAIASFLLRPRVVVPRLKGTAHVLPRQLVRILVAKAGTHKSADQDPPPEPTPQAVPATVGSTGGSLDSFHPSGADRRPSRHAARFGKWQQPRREIVREFGRSLYRLRQQCFRHRSRRHQRRVRRVRQGSSDRHHHPGQYRHPRKPEQRRFLRPRAQRRRPLRRLLQQRQ